MWRFNVCSKAAGRPRKVFQASGAGTSRGRRSRRLVWGAAAAAVLLAACAPRVQDFQPGLMAPRIESSFFVTEGKIYPKGTIQGDGASFDPNSDGAIGQWFCRGTHLVSGVEFPEARFAVDTAQAYLVANKIMSN